MHPSHTLLAAGLVERPATSLSTPNTADQSFHLFPHAFKYLHASMTSSAKQLRSGVTSSFALLDVLSHFVAVTGIARVSNAYCESVGYSFRNPFHHASKFRSLMLRNPYRILPNIVNELVTSYNLLAVAIPEPVTPFQAIIYGPRYPLMIGLVPLLPVTGDNQQER
jgi:hypothetical protein